MATLGRRGIRAAVLTTGLGALVLAVGAKPAGATSGNVVPLDRAVSLSDP